MRKESPYIGEPWQDWLLLVLSPLLACAASLAAAYAYTRRYGVPTLEGSAAYYAATGFVVNSHFVLAFFRTHGNREVFRRTPWRFTLVPLALYASMLTSDLVFCLAVFVNVWWDTWPSSSQTFGLCRIYDRKLGNDPATGRGLDLLLNWFIFTGPILAFAIREQSIANSVGALGGSYPALASALSRELHRVLLPASRLVAPCGALFVAYYIARFRALTSLGYRYSPLKLAILFSTLLAAVVSWGFNGWGAAVVSMNLFHSVQYFAIVWFAERENITSRFPRPSSRWALPAYVASGLAYGALFLLPIGSTLWLAKLGVTVATLHFWYDGFIWSVRRDQLPSILKSAPAAALLALLAASGAAAAEEHTVRVVQLNPYYAGRFAPYSSAGKSCGADGDCLGKGRVLCSEPGREGCWECIDHRCRERNWETMSNAAGFLALIQADVVGIEELNPRFAPQVERILERKTKAAWSRSVSAQGILGRGSGVGVFWRDDRVELDTDLGALDVDTLSTGYIVRFHGAILRLKRSGRSFGFFSGKLVWEDGGDDRRRETEARRLRRWIDERMHEHPDARARIIASDLNDTPGSLALRVLAGYDDGDARKPTSPGAGPKRRLDYLLWADGPGGASRRGFVTPQSDGRLGRSEFFGSDHRFVYGDALVP